KMGKNMQRVGRTLSVGLTAPILAFGGVALKSWDKQEKAIAQVNAGLISTGNAVGFTSEQLQKMASDLQNTSLFGDEEILQDATAQLLTFTNIAGEQFARTQQAAIDLSTRLGGDLKSASIQLGKALNDPVANLSALSRSGIQFSKEQKAVIKSLAESNKLADAQTIILDELARQYGGAGEAAAKAGLGGFKQLQNSIGDLMEDFGAIIAQAILPFVDKIKTMIASFKALSPATKKFIVILAGVAAAIGPILLLAGTILPAIASGFTLLMGPLGLVIAALTTVGVIIYKNWEPIKAQLVAIANYFIDLYNESTAFRVAVEYVTLQFKNMWSVVKFVFNAIYTLITGVVKQIINQFASMGAVFKGALTLDLGAVKKGLSDYKKATKENLSNVISSFKGDFNALTTDVAGNVQDALEKVANRKYKTILEVKVTPTGPGASMIQGGTVGGGAATRPTATRLDTSSFAAGIQPLVAGVTQSEADLDAGLTNIQDRFVDFSSEISGILTDTSVNMLTGFGVMIAGLIDGSLTMGDVAGGLLRIIGDLAIQLGEAAIKIGVGMLAIKAAFKNPFTAIAAGVALVAIGTLISNAANITSGGGNYAGAFATGGMVGGNSPVGDKLFARVNSGEMILNQAQQRNLNAMLTPNAQLLNVVLGGELTADAGKLKVVLDKYDTRKNRTS
ncbi:phage tail length tape measure family protein, partial [Polaribacter sp.]|uniref:phage tail length tape measure family protein n=1 Tax=Polaribacter sp. TaxID=1920175 RepID=UPI0025D373E2